MPENSDLALQSAESYTQEELAELTAINRKLHKQIIKYKMENVSLKERIAALEDELEERKKIPKFYDTMQKFAKVKENKLKKPEENV